MSRQSVSGLPCWLRRTLRFHQLSQASCINSRSGTSFPYGPNVMSTGNRPSAFGRYTFACKIAPSRTGTSAFCSKSISYCPVMVMAYRRLSESGQEISLEPISKSFEEDNEAGKLDRAEEIVGVVLPTNEDPALPLNPGEEALDEPASHVAA